MSTATADTAALILSGEGYRLEIAPDATEQKTKLIEAAAKVTEVNNEEGALVAREHVKELAAMRNLVEKSRKAIKAPVLQVGKDIDTKAAEFVAEITAEEKRISGLIATHAAEVERQRREAERLRQEEERKRLAAEAEAQRKAEEAEKAKQAADASFWDEDDDATKKAEADAAAKQAEADAEKARAEAIAQEERQRALAANTKQVDGVKWEPDFEVVDIHSVYRFSADFVEITPRRKPILDAIKLHMEQNAGELPDIPGLKVTKKAKVSTR